MQCRRRYCIGTEIQSNAYKENNHLCNYTDGIFTKHIENAGMHAWIDEYCYESKRRHDSTAGFSQEHKHVDKNLSLFALHCVRGIFR